MRFIAAIVSLCTVLGTAFGQPAAPTGTAESAAFGVAIDRESRSRLPLLTRADMQDDASAKVYDALAELGGEPPRGTLATALYSPATAAALHRIDTYLRTESPLGPRLVELLGLLTAREMDLAYEWSLRQPAALRAGVAPRLIDVVRLNQPTIGLEPSDALLIDFGRQVIRNRHVDSGTFAALVQQHGRHGAFDAMMALTYPMMAGMIQRAVDQQPPENWDARTLPAAAVGTPNGRPGDFVELPVRPPLAADVNEDSYYRLPLRKRAELDPRGREIFDRAIGADRDTAPRGPVGMSLNSPELVEPIQQINTALRMEGVLDTRLAEIVVAATGREMNNQYQWIVHGTAAERAGAGQAVLDAIRLDGDLDGLDERDAVAIAFTRDLFRLQTVRPAAFDGAMRHFGARGTVELAALVGDYLMMTTVYNALGMRLRPEQNPTLPHRTDAPIGAEWR